MATFYCSLTMRPPEVGLGALLQSLWRPVMEGSGEGRPGRVEFQGAPLRRRDRDVGGSLVLPLRHKLSRSLVERAFGLGPCTLTEAVQLVGERFEAEGEHDLAQEHHALQPEVCNRAFSTMELSSCCRSFRTFGPAYQIATPGSAGLSRMEITRRIEMVIRWLHPRFRRQTQTHIWI